jgi:ATP:corrinoid adenosyltransferase
MRVYLYTGGEKAKAVQRLAISTAGMQQPTLVARFGPVKGDDPLALWEGVLPIEVVRIRLPGLDWPLSHTPADEVAVKVAMCVLAWMIASGDYRLVILDGIHEAVSRNLLEAAALQRLAASSSDRTRIAMT